MSHAARRNIYLLSHDCSVSITEIVLHVIRYKKKKMLFSHGPSSIQAGQVRLNFINMSICSRYIHNLKGLCHQYKHTMKVLYANSGMLIRSHHTKFCVPVYSGSSVIIMQLIIIIIIIHSSLQMGLIDGHRTHQVPYNKYLKIYI
jgi:hypothetical protein